MTSNETWFYLFKRKSSLSSFQPRVLQVPLLTDYAIFHLCVTHEEKNVNIGQQKDIRVKSAGYEITCDPAIEIHNVIPPLPLINLSLFLPM